MTTKPDPSKTDLAILVARAAAQDGVKTRQPSGAALVARVEAAERARRRWPELDELKMKRLILELEAIRYPSASVYD